MGYNTPPNPAIKPDGSKEETQPSSTFEKGQEEILNEVSLSDEEILDTAYFISIITNLISLLNEAKPPNYVLAIGKLQGAINRLNQEN